MRKLITLGFFFSIIHFSCVFGQNKNKIDSLNTLLVKSSANDSGKVILLSHLCAAHGTFNPDKALEYGKSGLSIAKKLKYKRGEALCLNEMGTVYSNKGSYKEAVTYYLEALKINEEIENRRAAANNLINIGTIYRLQDNYDKALKYNTDALKMYEESGDTSGIAACYTNIGNLHYDAGNYQKALKYYQLTLVTFEKLSDKQNIATVLNNIGGIYFNQGNYEKAIGNFSKAMKICESIGDKLGIIIDLNNIGQVYFKQGDYKKAISYYNKSLDHALDFGAKDLIKFNYENLSEVSEKMNDFKSAFSYYKRYSDIKDTILNAQISKQIDEMAIKYETEKKEKENALLKKETTQQLFLNKRQKERLNYLMLGLIIISATGVLFFIRSRSRKKTNEFLKELVDLKTQEENELRKAKNAVEQSMKLKEQFLANISHEIRTPLNAVIGFTDLLHKGHLGPNEKEYIYFIKTAGENLVNILNDILDMSKIEAGKIMFEEKQVSIFELFKSLQILLDLQAKEKKLELSFRCDDSVPELVTGDPTRLTQIFINLIGNAIKFTEKGKVAVSAELLKEEEDLVYLQFTVKDTGIGIPQEKLSLIFERFRQAEADTTRKYGGTGLGLSIVKHLVELQDGTISLVSEVDKGSEFSFCIPFKRAKQQNIEPTDVIVKKEALNLEGVKILLAEDNILNVKLVLAVFADTGILVDVTGNGKEAIEQLRRKDYDLVLMDMQMPVMDGYQATTYIRETMKNDIPIVAMTAHAMAGEKEKCLLIGMNDYIPKPINADVLFDKINTLTSNREKNPVAEKLINLNYLSGTLKIKNNTIKEMLDDFKDQMAEDFPSLSEAVSNGDFVTIGNISHKLKSPASMMGMVKMERILIDMETHAASKDGIEKMKLFIEELDIIYGKVLEEIEIEKTNL